MRDYERRDLSFMWAWKISICLVLAMTQGQCAEEFLQADQLVITFEKCVNLALQSQRKLGSSVGAVLQSEINLELAESDFNVRIVPKADTGYAGGGSAGSGFTVGAGVDISRKFPMGTFIGINPSLMKLAGNFQSNIRAIISQPLLRGFGKDYNYAAIYGAQYNNRSAIRSLYTSQIRLLLQAIQGLYEIAKIDAFTSLEKESYERVKKFCISTKIKEKIGLCDSLDVYRAEIEMKHAEDNLSNSLDRLQDNKDILRDILGLPLDLSFEVSVPIEYDPMNLSLEEAREIALSNRIELEQAHDQVRENQRLQSLAKRNLLPDLNVVVDYTSFAYDEVFSRSWTTKRESRWGIGFTSSTDLCNFKEKAAHEQSIRATLDAELNTEIICDNIVLEVKRNLRTLKRATERIKIQEEQIQNAFKEFHLSKLKFEHGMANNFDMIQAEKNLRSAQTALVAAIIDHRIGEFVLLASLGTLADKPKRCK